MNKWYNIKASKDINEIYLFGDINPWGNGAKEFVDTVKNLKGDIVLHINSAGGSVFEGLAIYNLIRGIKNKVKTKIVGLAASMASVIALAGDEVEMSENSLFMIHNPTTVAGGDKKSLEKSIKVISQIEDIMVNIYTSHSKLSHEEVREAMNVETFYTASEAYEHGFVSKIIKEEKIAACADASAYKSEKYREWILKTENTKRKEGEVPEESKNGGQAVHRPTEEKMLLEENQQLKAELEKVKKEKANIEVISKVSSDIEGKKILPGEKEFAEELLRESPKLYDRWIENKPKVDLGASIDIAEGSNDRDWEYYLSHHKEMEELMTSNPKGYAKMKEEYEEGLR